MQVWHHMTKTNLTAEAAAVGRRAGVGALGLTAQQCVLYCLMLCGCSGLLHIDLISSVSCCCGEASLAVYNTGHHVMTKVGSHGCGLETRDF